MDWTWSPSLNEVDLSQLIATIGRPSLFRFWLFAVVALFSAASFAAPPQNFSQAKLVAKQQVYFDRDRSPEGTLYCGCQWEWTTKTGGKPDLLDCGYEVRKQPARANRTEWEHIVPAWTFGHQRQCWQNGGRKNCVATDPFFVEMEANLHNLSVAIGEVNADRNNFNYGMVNGSNGMYGKCASKTDFKQRVFEPRNEAKGLVARVTFYMHDRYGLTLSRQQQQLLMAWSKMFPVSAWEQERDNRIAQIMGHHNPFVTGEKQWTLGFKPSGEGLTTPSQIAPIPSANKAPPTALSGQIIGNRNSRIYHFSEGCKGQLPAEKNRVYFDNEAQAKAAGYRKSGGCQ